MNNHFLTLLIIMIIAGLLGGTISFLSTKKSKDWWSSELADSLIWGVGAALLVPLFLNMISSNLIRESKDDSYKLLIFFGFCLIAAFSSKKFFNSIADRVLNDVQKKQNELEEKVDTVIVSQAEIDEKEDVELEYLSEIGATETEILEVDKTKSEETKEKSKIENAITDDFTFFFFFDPKIYLRIYDSDSVDAKVIKSLGNGQYKYRSLKGISKDTGIIQDNLTMVLGELINIDIVSSITRNKDNKMLYVLTEKGKRQLFELNKLVKGTVTSIVRIEQKNKVGKNIFKVTINNLFDILIYSKDDKLPFSVGEKIIAHTVNGKRVDISKVASDT